MADVGQPMFIAKEETSQEILMQLDKLDPIQQSIISGFAPFLNKGGTVFIADGTLTVPEGITEITVNGCGAGGTGYCGQAVKSQKITVIPNEILTIKCGSNKPTEILRDQTSLLYLSNASSTHNDNFDHFNIGITLGLRGGNGKAGNSGGGKAGGYGGNGGNGGSYGFGGGGGAGGSGGGYGGSGAANYNGGTGVGSTSNVVINGVSVKIKGSSTGGSGGGGTSVGGSLNNEGGLGGYGGSGGDAGGFGGGGGYGGSGGEGYYKNGSSGGNGNGSQGFLVLNWGLELG